MRDREILSYVTRTPWAILPEKAAAIRDLVALHSAGLTLTPQEIEARIGERREREESSAGAGLVALINVSGVLAYRMDMIHEASGGTSTERLTARIREAANDDAVEAIVLDIDSEGGAADGIPELWKEIYDARQKKQVVAVANSLAASAAYWMGSAAEEFIATPSASVGSVGVMILHFDESEAFKALGVKPTLIRAGKYKVEANPFEPLSEEAEAHLQHRVDETYDQFVADIAKGRGVKVAEVRKGFGQGRVLGAKDALAENMVDKIATLDATINRLVGRKGKRSMVSFAIEPKDGQARWTVKDNGTVIAAGPLATAPLEVSGVQEVLFAGVIPKSPTNEWAPEDQEWKAPALEDFTDEPWEEISDAEKRRISGHFLWAPKMPPDRFTDLKGPHHNASDGKVNWRGLSNLVARFNQVDIPAEDKPGAKRHLRGHYQDGDKDIPDILEGKEGAPAPVANDTDMRQRRLRLAQLRNEDLTA